MGKGAALKKVRGKGGGLAIIKREKFKN